MSVEPSVMIHIKGSDSFSLEVLREIEQKVRDSFSGDEQPILWYIPTPDDPFWIGYFSTLKDVSDASIKAIDRLYRELEANTDWSIEVDWEDLEEESFEAEDDFGNHVRNRERLRS
ncbi:hypothetical protein [Corynebacterium sp. HS2168-gen11]|uniref:hypothetical protein n=1 Tax=Corynebacterium sp. HS2168-gen11 TaxID=2974027 RepID=UPI00216AB7B8|nr:hypothetical protein [Corynebacterium sp. HS2168-gen11]MCS4535262.1 hypothetical protein [Corynebacterium sp. HS2168-gen11]